MYGGVPGAHQGWFPATQQGTKKDPCSAVWQYLYSPALPAPSAGVGLGAAQHRTTPSGPEADWQPAEPGWQLEGKQQLLCYFSPSKSCKIHEKSKYLTARRKTHISASCFKPGFDACGWPHCLPISTSLGKLDAWLEHAPCTGCGRSPAVRDVPCPSPVLHRAQAAI